MVIILLDSVQNNLQGRYFFQDATTPGGPGPPDYQGFTITHTPQPVGLLWTRDQPEAETSTWQNTSHNRPTSMATAGIEPAIPAWKRPQILTPRGHCNLQFKKPSTLVHILVLSVTLNRNKKNFLELVRTYEFPSITLSSNGCSLTKFYSKQPRQ